MLVGADKSLCLLNSDPHNADVFKPLGPCQINGFPMLIAYNICSRNHMTWIDAMMLFHVACILYVRIVISQVSARVFP